MEVPHKPTAENERDFISVTVPFTRDGFGIARLGKIGNIVEINIPEGITVTVDPRHNLNITTSTRSQPITVRRSDRVTFSVKEGRIVIEADISDRQGKARADGAMMDLALVEKDVLATLTYVQGKSDPLDSGIIATTATPPASATEVADWHKAT